MPTNHLLRLLCFSAMTLLLAAASAKGQDSVQPSSDTGIASDGTTSSDDAAAQYATVVSAVTNAPAPSSRIKQLGTTFPLETDPRGLRIGPVHMTSISSSMFVDLATPQGQSTQEYWGTSVGTNLIYSHPVRNGILVVQGNPTVSIAHGSAYLNTVGSIDFSKQLTPRWSMTASGQWTFYQNAYLLQTSQYLLAYAAGGLVLQRLYVQQAGSTVYESTAFSMNYQLSGRSQLSLSPVVGFTFADVDGALNLVGQVGASATLTHSFTPNRSAFVYGSATRAHSSLPVNTAPANTPPNSGISKWNNHSLGGGVNQKIGQSWYVTLSAGASHQQQATSSQWTPTGSASVMKAFRSGNISAAYTRTFATQVLLSSGYYDQADVAYVTHLNPKVTTGLGVGSFRSVNTGSSEHGTRAYASVSYHWVRNLVWSFAYNFSTQTGTQSSLLNGTTTNFNFGLNWGLGHSSRQ